jgi:hypothetical protein
MKYIKLIGLNKKEIRKQIHELEAKGMYFGKCISNLINEENKIELIFKVENQFMDKKEYDNLTIDHDPRITIGARVRIKNTNEEFTLKSLYEFSISHKVVYLTSDGRKWKPSTVYKRCIFVK